MTIRRGSLLRTFALNEVSDDYENFNKVERECRGLFARCGLAVTPREVVDALDSLIIDGLVKAYWLSALGPVREIEGVPAETDIPHIYFLQTDKGKSASAMDSNWPFGDDGRLQPGVLIVPDSE